MEYLKADLKQKQKIFAEDGSHVSIIRILMSDAPVPMLFIELCVGLLCIT